MGDLEFDLSRSIKVDSVAKLGSLIMLHVLHINGHLTLLSGIQVQSILVLKYVCAI